MLRFNHLVTCSSRNNCKHPDDTRKWYKFIFSSISFFDNFFLCVSNMKNFKNMKNIGRGKEVGKTPWLHDLQTLYNGHPDPLPLLLCTLHPVLFCSAVDWWIQIKAWIKNLNIFHARIKRRAQMQHENLLRKQVEKLCQEINYQPMLLPLYYSLRKEWSNMKRDQAHARVKNQKSMTSKTKTEAQKAFSSDWHKTENARQSLLSPTPKANCLQTKKQSYARRNATSNHFIRTKPRNQKRKQPSFNSSINVLTPLTTKSLCKQFLSTTN